MYEIRQAKREKVIKPNTANILLKILQGLLTEELMSDEPINLQWRWRQFDFLYKMFEEEGYINYELYTKESDTEASEVTEYNLVLAIKNNIYPYCARHNDI